MFTPSHPITSNQNGPHEDLLDLVKKHQQSEYRQPIKDISLATFDVLLEWLNQRSGMPLIFDACCGTGQSTHLLATKHPDHVVVGFDKSSTRLERGNNARNYILPENALVLHMDAVDLWLLATHARIRPVTHYFFYPNPWPKKKHVQRRWHGHGVFPTLIGLGGNFHLRANWRIYVEEFAAATEFLTNASGVIQTLDTNTASMTLFEDKYKRSGHTLWTYDLIQSSR